MKQPLRTLVGLAGVAALTLGSSASATAATWWHDDDTGDVETYTWDAETDEETGPDPAPDNTYTDVTRVTVKHRARRLGLVTELVDITAQSGFVQYEVRTGDRAFWVMHRLGADRSFPAFLLMRANGNRVACSGVRRSVDRSLERSMVSIPRRCLGGPRWVRVGAGVISFEESGADETVFLDDGLRGAPSRDVLTRSPRVYRG